MDRRIAPKILVLFLGIILIVLAFVIAESTNKDNIFTKKILPVLTSVSDKKEEVKKYPDLKLAIVPLKLSAKAYTSVFVSEEGSRVLIEKKAGEKLPIASITKLMTAIVASQNYGVSKKIVLTGDAFVEKDAISRFSINDSFFFSDTLKVMLIESNNVLAQALADSKGINWFVYNMNAMAEELGMLDTHYTNPTGLDPEDGTEPNYSTPRDLVKLAEHLLFKRQDILAITDTITYDLYDTNDVYRYTASNTNKLLQSEKNPFPIVGGKTGFTDLAKRNLLLITKLPEKNGYVVNVVLGSNDHFADMMALTSWIKIAYE